MFDELAARTSSPRPPARWALAMSVALIHAHFSCGGTSGLPALPNGTSLGPGDATAAGETYVATDATSSVDSDGDDSVDFDAGIQYADPDRLSGFVALDVAASTASEAGVAEASSAAGSQWPACAQDTYSPHNDVLHREVPDDSGSCLSYQWAPTFGLGCEDAGATSSNQCLPCDQCLRKAQCGLYGVLLSANTRGVFPPCSDLQEAGTAAHGQGAGRRLFDLCATLFDCVSRSSCTGADPTDPTASPSNCYCGTSPGAACVAEGGANGVCKKEIEEAVQAGPSTSPSDILANLTDETNPMGLPGSHAGTEVMGLLTCALTADCKRCFTGSPDGG